MDPARPTIDPLGWRVNSRKRVVRVPIKRLNWRSNEGHYPPKCPASTPVLQQCRIDWRRRDTCAPSVPKWIATSSGRGPVALIGHCVAKRRPDPSLGLDFYRDIVTVSEGPRTPPRRSTRKSHVPRRKPDP